MNQQAPAPQQTNGLGIAGFIVSLVGFLSCGLLSPIGLILSIVALGRQPKGFAIAGLVLGLLGSCGFLATLIAFLLVPGLFVAAGLGAALVGAAGMFGPEIETGIEVAVIASEVQEHRQSQGSLPASLDDLPLDPDLLTDGWGNAYLYEPGEDGVSFRLYSAGPDGQAGTPDDISADV